MASLSRAFVGYDTDRLDTVQEAWIKQVLDRDGKQLQAVLGI
jgi:hypothetical protein